MSILEKLSKIQAELKTPKNHYSEFGNYHFRSCEDILEAVKPIAKKYGALVTLNDEIILVGDKYFVRTIATLHDAESDKIMFATASAEIAASKPKLDASQITGSASSYARKYALNGLFAIDDTKDSDALPPTPTPTPTNTQKVSKKDHVADIGKMVMEMVNNDKAKAKEKLQELCKTSDLKELEAYGKEAQKIALEKVEEAYKKFKAVK